MAEDKKGYERGAHVLGPTAMERRFGQARRVGPGVTVSVSEDGGDDAVIKALTDRNVELEGEVKRLKLELAKRTHEALKLVAAVAPVRDAEVLPDGGGMTVLSSVSGDEHREMGRPRKHADRPWEVEGVSRRTWERRQAQQREGGDE